MATITNPDLVRVGYYATFCCHLDLFRIENEEELKDVQEDLQMWESGEDRTLRRYVWPTYREALLEIRLRFLPNDKEPLSEIDALLAEIPR